MKKVLLIALLAMFLFGTLAISACKPKAQEVEEVEEDIEDAEAEEEVVAEDAEAEPVAEEAAE